MYHLKPYPSLTCGPARLSCQSFHHFDRPITDYSSRLTGVRRQATPDERWAMITWGSEPIDPAPPRWSVKVRPLQPGIDLQSPGTGEPRKEQIDDRQS